MTQILHVVTGEKLKISNQQLVVVRDDKKFGVDLDNIECIIVESMQCSISVSVHNICAKANIPIIICNEKHQPEVFCHNLYSYYQLTHKIYEQVKWINEEKKTILFKQIIMRKLEHQYEMLNILGKKDDSHKLLIYIDKLKYANDESVIENCEAISARIYFKSLFGRRFKRMENDTLNAGLNYGYMLLRAAIMMQIVAKGFHPSIGIFHHSMFNNYNLADDIIEIYRPMVDYVVYLSIRNDEEFNKKHRQKLQQVILQRVKIKDSKVSFKNSVFYYLDNIYNFMNQNKQIHIPRIEVGLYQF